MSLLRSVLSIIMVSLLGILLLSCSGKKPATAVSATTVDSVRSDSSNQPTADSIARKVTYEQLQGYHLYTKYCSVCHGEDGKGSGFNAFNLDPKPRDFTDAKYMNALTDEHILQTISGGGRSVNRSSLMPSWGGRMQKEELRFLLSYIRTFSSSQ